MPSLEKIAAARLGLTGLPRSPGELARAQMAAIRRTVSHAARYSPFYQKLLAGVAPEEIRSPAELAKLPFTCGGDLRQRPESFLAASQSQVSRVLTVHSSGSTGRPKRVFLGREDLARTAEFFAVGLGRLWGGGAKVAALLPHDTPDGAGRLLKSALEAAGMACHCFWPPDDPGRAAGQLRRCGAEYLIGLPVHLLALAGEIGPGVLKGVLFCSEYVPASLRARVEAALDAPSLMHYGSSESGLGGAVECRAGQGCHSRSGDLYWEVVDPESGKQLADGEKGELVLTTLSRRVMPLIRYRTGDLASLGHQPCSCGALGQRLLYLGGRLGGVALGKGRTLRMAELDEALFGLPGLMDFAAGLDMAGRLRLDYVDPGGICPPEMAAARAAVLPALARGFPVPLARRVERLAASHTIKRIITDSRDKGGSR